MTAAGFSIADLLLVAPAAAKEAWQEWRSAIDLDQLDGPTLALLPLLAGRLPEWLSNDGERNRILGICRRGWAENQLRYGEAAGIIETLRRGGAEPIAVFGGLAWSMIYQQEKAVRPIESLDILIGRDDITAAVRALQAAGWVPESAMPLPEGRALDQFPGIWLRSHSGTSLQIAWRLWNVSPELARDHEALTHAAKIDEIDIHGVRTCAIPTEELLLEALTRERNGLVSWQSDAAVLLRNRSVDWGRLRALARHFPSASARLAELREHATKDSFPTSASLPKPMVPSIPSGILDRRPPGRLRRRISGIRIDYRQAAWLNGQPDSLAGFVSYLLKRLFRRPGERPR